MPAQKIDFAMMFETTPTPLMVLDTGLCFVAANDCYLKVTDRQRNDLIGCHVFDAFPESGDRKAVIKNGFDKALAGEANKIEKLLFAISRPDGSFHDVYWTCQQEPVRDAGGHIVGVMQHPLDVSSEVAAERMRDAISQEYDHRVRNILTKVSAIARRTARSTETMQQFIADFDPRISAMARAHQLLVHGGWERLGLAELVASELQPYASRNEGQIRIDGPNVTLSSRTAQAVGMALHELATNAVKYGALRQATGQLYVEWWTETGALHLEWRETGLTNVVEPLTLGFGSKIIDRILPAETSGTVARKFLQTGMICRIEIPDPALG